MQPTNWNVVVRASWNLAILTPRGIAQRLFGLPAGTPVEIRIPLDGRNPYQVHHDGLVVVASEDQLIVEPDVCDIANLKRAMLLGSRALEQLPETPCTAAGFNLRYEINPVPDTLLDVVQCAMDDRLAEAGHILTARKRGAAWQYGEGILNVEIALDGNAGLVALNFHRTSTDVASLRQWLDPNVREVEERIERLSEILGLVQHTAEHHNA